MKIIENIRQHLKEKKEKNILAINYSKGLKLIEQGREFCINKKDNEALECFNTAIELGVRTYYPYSMRASCLCSLGRYLESIVNYDTAISLSPNLAQEYHGRSIAKSFIKDHEGCISDLKEAIRLSKEDNENNRWWNNYSKNTRGVNTATEIYEEELAEKIRRIEIDKKIEEMKS